MNRIARFTRIASTRAGVETNRGFMKPGIVGLATALVVSGGLWMAGLLLGAGNAQAVCSNYPPQSPQCAPPEGPPACYDSSICSQEWCPNMGRMRRMPNWDMTVCHTYYFAPNSGLPALIVQGQPPGSPLPPNTGVCPPFAFMCP